MRTVDPALFTPGWSAAYNPGMKFSIRDVLWLTVVAALAVCWGIDRVQFRRELVNARRAELRARMESERAMAESERSRYMAEFARASMVAGGRVEAELQSTATTPDPQANPPSATTSP